MYENLQNVRICVLTRIRNPKNNQFHPCSSNRVDNDSF